MQLEGYGRAATPTAWRQALNRKIWQVYLCVSIATVLGLTVLTPPFQVPDEQQHFFRAYQISECRLRALVENGQAGAVLPSSLIELAERFLGTRAVHAERTLRPAPLSATVQALRIPLDPGRREFTNFFGAAFYSPVPYLPQAAAIALGRAAGLGPLGLLYMARLANGLTASLVTGLALRLLPIGATALLVFALLPMTLYEFASVSPDAGVIAAAFLFTALALRARAQGEWSGGEVAAACLAGVAFCVLKPVYAPLLVLGLPFGLRRGSAVNTLAAYATILVVTLGATVAWFAYAKAAVVIPFPDVDPMRQLAVILAAPRTYVTVLHCTAADYALAWTQEMIGMLGWLNLRLPLPMYLLPVAALVLCTLLPKPRLWRPRLIETAWYAFLVLASAVLVLTALYLYFNRIGAGRVSGVQGRYFLPLAGALAAILESRLALLPPRLAGWSTWAVVILLVIEAVLTGLVVQSAYGVI